MTLHWCGTGLSSIPGLRRLIDHRQRGVGQDREIHHQALADAILGKVADPVGHGRRR